ncbi:MAG: serine hydrolase [Haliscomenobacter sp.]|uniref:serine hydrolase n=1 Tax=Haliscomenobacter sp. TaxID=2717303 RepID=UPI0029B33BB1|nr:serine hydrolase [Haliscomenobacter sp.]MDX2068849.1 serine hydrolase [Haliscomenobacter sp.]
MKFFPIFLSLSLLGNCLVLAQTGIPVPQLSNCDQLVNNFLTKYSIPGASLAISRNGKMVYARGFGFTSESKTEMVQPGSLFRIASVSKPITAIAIMKLVQDGKLKLDDKVFGTNGILGKDTYLSKANVSDARINSINIQQLLEHSAGWDRDIDCTPNPVTPYPYNLNSCDPISFPLHVTKTLGENNPVNERMLIRFVLEKGLNFAPGTKYAYSNMGYLVLGLVIEQITGKTYEAYLKQDILEPLGIFDLHLGKNLLKDKLEREVEYSSPYTTLSLYGNGTNVPWQYGGWNLEAMDAHGGWVATARDLVRLLVAVDGFASKPDILNSSSISNMVKPATTSSFYAKGWQVNNNNNNWWHTGSLDGTASIIVRSSGGFTWALLMNKRVDGNNQFWTDLDNLPWNCITGIGSFPSFDLLAAPIQAAKDLRLTQNAGSKVTLEWEKGSGTRRLLVLRKGNTLGNFPVDGTSYLADSAFQKGSKLSTDAFVVYNANGNKINVSGLELNTTYTARLFEYTQNAESGDAPLYLLGKSPILTFTTSAIVSSTYDLGGKSLKLYPNPSQGEMWLEMLEEKNLLLEIFLSNGQKAWTQQIKTMPQGQYPIPINQLPKGMLLLKVTDLEQVGRPSIGHRIIHR